MLRGCSSSSVGTGTSWLVILFLVGLLTSSLGDSLGILLVLVDSPIKDVVVLETLTDEQVTEDLSEVGVVWLVIESKRAGVVEVDGELVGEATAKHLGGGGHLLLHDSVVLLLLGRSLQALPRKRTTAEIEHNVSERLHIVTTGLLCKTKLACIHQSCTCASQITYRRPSGC